ncbi:MAG: SDR family oxidoreductase [Marinomonas sp.]
MKIEKTNAIITGATGGIGRRFAQHLVENGANVLLVARDTQALLELKEKLINQQGIDSKQVTIFSCDLLEEEQRRRLISYIEDSPTAINTLINSAGDNQFSFLEDTPDKKIEQIIKLNTLTPILLSKALLPHLEQQDDAQIVNIGSTFGSIGYPGFSSYCASKYALRGFSEALGRELSQTNVKIKYLSPRATNTKLSTANIIAMNKELNVAMDSPDEVAEQLLRLLDSDMHELAIGWPERFFSKLNQVLPNLVSKAISKQLPTIRRHAGLV